MLAQIGGFETENMIDVAPRSKTISKMGVKRIFGSLNEKLNEKSQFILYLRGYISQTNNLNVSYLLPTDAILGNPSTYVRAKDFENWLKPIRLKLRPECIMLLLEGYLQRDTGPPKTNPFHYLGIPTLWLAQPLRMLSNARASDFLKRLSDVLSDPQTDLDRDLSVTNEEVHKALTSHVPSVAYTGGKAMFFQLPSRIEIRTDLTDAKFFIDDEKGRQREV